MIVLVLNEQGQSSLKLELYVFTLRLVVWNGYLLAQLFARLLAEPRQRRQRLRDLGGWGTVWEGRDPGWVLGRCRALARNFGGRVLGCMEADFYM